MNILRFLMLIAEFESELAKNYGKKIDLNFVARFAELKVGLLDEMTEE